MKLAIMQPYFFPYIGYFQLIKAVDKYILYDNVNYIERGWVNRNRLLVLNRKPVYITVPIIHKSSFSKINEIIIDNNQSWKKRLLKMLNYNYKKSEYYAETYPMLVKIINYDTNSLSEFNYYSIKSICSYLEINTCLEYNCANYENIEEEVRNLQKMKIECNSDRMTSRIIKICNRENANIYINTIGGIKLYSKEAFIQNNIELYFLETLPCSYKQNSSEFFLHLSIIDVLMNCGKYETMKMLDKFKLL